MQQKELVSSRRQSRLAQVIELDSDLRIERMGTVAGDEPPGRIGRGSDH